MFLGEKQVTGIELQLDATTRVLAAASAIIPIFGFPDWEWDQISEVLIYPSRFDGEFSFGDSRGHDILGMVGTGGLNRLMILSKPDLISGFRNAGDKRNVGVHEFAHLVDKSDGVVDGTPQVGLDRRAIGPWVDLVRRKMAEIEAGHSDVNRYALTNEAEFFAIVSEYFFERPGIMQRIIRNSMHSSSECSTKTFVPGRRRFGVSSHRSGRPLAGTLLVHVAAGKSSKSAVYSNPSYTLVILASRQIIGPRTGKNALHSIVSFVAREFVHVAIERFEIE